MLVFFLAVAVAAILLPPAPVAGEDPSSRAQSVETPDLVLVDLSFSDSTPAVHEELIIKARIRNNGTRELDGVQVSFLDDYYTVPHARYIGLVSNLTIPANETIEVRAWWLPQAEGTHHIRVKADSTGVIKEIDEDNNELVTNVPVGPTREEGLSLPSIGGEFLDVIWPALAVASGFSIGLAAHLARRRSIFR